MTSTEDTTTPTPAADGHRRSDSDKLITIADIRTIFKLGRTAAYDLTHRQDFPDPVEISPRCYRWWASEVDEFATTLRRDRVHARPQQRHDPHPPDLTTLPRRITGRPRPIQSRREAS